MTRVLQIVTAIAQNSKAASEILQQITRTALNRAHETAGEFHTSFQATAQNNSAH